MPYSINLTDGTLFANLADGTTNTTSSMTLVGRDVPTGWGEILNENYMRLLENGANTVAPSALSTLTGQLWYDKSNGLIKVFNSTLFKTLGVVDAQAIEPTAPVTGDMWFNTTLGQLNIHNGTSFVGVATTVVVLSDGTSNHTVTQQYVDGTLVSIISADPAFTPSPALTGFATIYPGYNLSTDIANVVFAGTATNSELLDSLDSTQFLRSDTNDTTSGSLGVLNDAGLIIGADSDLQISITGTTSYIESLVSDTDLILRVNDGGVVTDVITLDGASARARVDTPLTSTDVANMAYTDTKVSSTGGAISGNLTFGDNDKVIFGDGSDLQMYHLAGTSTILNNDGDLLITNNGADITITAAAASTTVDIEAAGVISASFGGASQEALLYFGGVQTLATTATGVSVAGNVAASAAAPVAIDDLTRKDYVDGIVVAFDDPTTYGVTVQAVLNGAWTTVLVDADARFAFVSGYATGIFDTSGAVVASYARKPGLVGDADTKWVVTEVGHTASAGTSESSVRSGSVLVECNGSGEIEIYGYKSTATVVAPITNVTVKGYIK